MTDNTWVRVAGWKKVHLRRSSKWTLCGTEITKKIIETSTAQPLGDMGCEQCLRRGDVVRQHIDGGNLSAGARRVLGG